MAHDPVKQSKYLKQALAQDKLSIGFFIGAGCPLAIDMPQESWPLIPDVTGLTKHVEEVLGKGEVKVLFATLIEELKKTGRTEYNIEDILTFVRSLRDVSKGGTVRGLTEDQLIKIEENICSVIGEKVSVILPDQENPYRRLANWIQSIERSIPLEVFTTNYDLLVEQAFEGAQVPYFDGFVGSNKSFFDLRAVEDGEIPEHWVRFWKLHGSLNWHRASDGQIFRGAPKGSDNPLHLIYPSHLKYDQSRKMPFLALVDRLHKFISRQNSVLLVSGYSFSDEHLNNVLISGLKANPRATVFAFLFDKLNSYPKAISLASRCSNLALIALDKGIIGTVEGYWEINQELSEVDNSIQKLISKIESIEGEAPLPNVEFSIGDFNNFTLFLKHLISEESKKNAI